MKIRLAILENDTNYLQRIVSVFNNKYGNELEIYSFTETFSALNCLEEKKIDVFLANEAFNIDFNHIPSKCGFAYLVESLDIDKINGKKTICKFQKCELIYKQVLSIYSEQIPNIIGISTENTGTIKTVAFTAPGGGTGASTCAAACAIAFAAKGYRTLYLDLEVYGCSDNYFSCDGQFDFSDVIYAIKSHKTNRAMKLQSTLKQDSTGVYYYSSVKVPLDMMELTPEDYVTLQNEIQMLGQFDYVVIDMDFPRTRDEFHFLEHCNQVVFVTDDSYESEHKLDSALRAIQIIDGQSEFSIQPRTSLIRNQCINSYETVKHEIRTLGAFPRYESVAPAQLARQLALSNVFEQLL